MFGIAFKLPDCASVVLWLYLLAWLALELWSWSVRLPWSIGLLAVLVVLPGSSLVTLLQLEVGAAESGLMRYGLSGAALAGAFSGLAWVVMV
ncbi:MAG: hypothetical protein CSA09_02110 [Candidatus Contendobacter odensis]|uniref:Uncharacterized protein n=1 Tax=Candidatus Contendibacter odensensis TaxID=1400860 RepID=A0A2G6PFG5_9GAMM|nr:MAG: hypothetical protein CSA09_02110 [Candidatus Contendobacter odensis]